MKVRVEATLIFVTDVQVSKVWYQDVLGMTVSSTPQCLRWNAGIANPDGNEFVIDQETTESKREA